MIPSERELPAHLGGLNAEGTTAAASAFHVRVVELKSRTLDRFDVVDFNTFKVHGAHLIDGDLETIEVQNLIGLVGLVFKSHMVLETRATATDDSHTQGHRHRTLHLHDFLDLRASDRRQIDHKVL